MAVGRQAVDHCVRRGYRALVTWGRWELPLRAARFSAVEERCQELDIPLGTVKSRIFKARNKLKETLIRQGQASA